MNLRHKEKKNNPNIEIKMKLYFKFFVFIEVINIPSKRNNVTGTLLGITFWIKIP